MGGRAGKRGPRRYRSPIDALRCALRQPGDRGMFIADWEQGVGLEYARLATGEKHLRSHVEELLGGPVDTVETYGGGLVNGSCENKLSEKLLDLLTCLGAGYSKRTQGQDMLLRIRPAKV